MRLVVVLLLMFAPTATADWDQAWINEAENIEETIHRIRVVEGLYSQTTLPFLFDLKALATVSDNYDEILRSGARIRIVFDRNPFNEDNYRRLAKEYTYVLSDLSCIERSDWSHYINQKAECGDFRHFIADSYMQAIRMTERLAQESGLKEDWEEVVRLADFLIWILPGVDGPLRVVERRNGTLEMIDNPDTRQQYRTIGWAMAKRRAEKALEEFNNE